MASLGHLAIGMATARASASGGTTRRGLAVSMAGWCVLSMLPDCDVIGFPLGIRYADEWGHRGATHSFVFALLIGAALGMIALLWGRRPFRSGLIASAVLASHPLLDILTDGGLGCALFWPFDLGRYFAPWTPIPVAPIGSAFFSSRGLQVALSELMIFSPFLLYAIWPRSLARHGEGTDQRPPRAR